MPQTILGPTTQPPGATTFAPAFGYDLDGVVPAAFRCRLERGVANAEQPAICGV